MAVEPELRKQDEGDLCSLVGLRGDGYLVRLAEKDLQDEGKENRLKKYIGDPPVKEFMYKDGKGMDVMMEDILKFQRKYGGKGVDPKRAEWRPNRESQKPRVSVCWDLDKRGTVGETVIHLCMLNLRNKASKAHTEVIYSLLHRYPKLVNDFYVGGQYFGETALHMAIAISQDHKLVQNLLEAGADVQARACGNFFERDGDLYWGEYPLSFAVCAGKEEYAKLLLQHGADINAQDYYGNTAMHLAVLQQNQHMVDYLYERGAKLDIANNDGLTPLSLAAKLAYKDMYDHILKKEVQVFWIYNNVVSTGYQLTHIDSISPDDGKTNTKSALHLIVYGEKNEHVEMMDDLITKLLEDKWKHFAKKRFILRFVLFFIYCAMFVTAMALRPGTDLCATQNDTSSLRGCNQTGDPSNRTFDNCYLLRWYRPEDFARLFLEGCVVLGASLYLVLALWKTCKYEGCPECPKTRDEFKETLRSLYHKVSKAPSMGFMLLGCLLVLLMIPGRFTCSVMGDVSHRYEDVMGVLAILCTVPHFLFFCRGWRPVGPFVVMTYKMITGDLLKFFIIYAVLVIGFSQAFYIPFRTQDKAVFYNSFDSIMGLFSISVGGDMFDSIDELTTPRKQITEFLFVVYMVLVTLLLINMLIAMMGNTYTIVSTTEKEWFRQRARIILMIEEGLSPDFRKTNQKAYSQPTEGAADPDKTRTFVIRSQFETPEEKKVLKELNELRIKNRRPGNVQNGNASTAAQTDSQPSTIYVHILQDSQRDQQPAAGPSASTA